MAKTKNEENVSAIEREIAQIREDIANLAASVKQHGEVSTSKGTFASETGSGTDEQNGWAELQQALKDMRARGETALHDLTMEVERHPLRSIAVAIGIGYIAGRLFGGRRNR